MYILYMQSLAVSFEVIKRPIKKWVLAAIREGLLVAACAACETLFDCAFSRIKFSKANVAKVIQRSGMADNFEKNRRTKCYSSCLADV